MLNNFLNQTSAGAANISFNDDGADYVWALPDETTLAGTVYNQASVTVGTSVVPVPAAAWLFVSAIGGLVSLKRRV